MNALALWEVHPGTAIDPRTAIDPGTERRSPARSWVAEDLCFGCGKALAEGEEKNCADCADLALHNGECRHCGRLLANADLAEEACGDCTA